MPNFSSAPGGGGVAGIVAGTIVVSVIMSAVTGVHTHWPFVLLGLVVGIMAAHSINR